MLKMLSIFFFSLLIIGNFGQNLGGYTYEEFNHFNYEVNFYFLAINQKDSGRNWDNFNWQCLTGMHQSPIEIDNTTSIPLQRNFILHLQKAATVSGIEIVNNGHSIQANYNWLEFQATNVQGQVKEYKAVQVHFHTPSEHSFNGNLRDLEIHIVCDQVGGPTDNGLTKGVFAIILEYNQFYEDNPLIEPFSQAAAGYAPQYSAHTETVDANLYHNLKNELEKFEDSLNPLTYYTYQGSYTTPPCTEIVEWYVLKQALPISFKQLWNFQKLWTYNFNFAQGNGNNRIVQKNNGRTIVQGIVTAHIEKYGNFLQCGILILALIALLF